MKNIQSKKVRSVCLAASLAFAAMSGIPAMAATINVDFDPQGGANFTGTAVAPDAGTVWNSVNPGPLLTANFTTGPLVNSTNGTSTVSLTLNNSFSYGGGPVGQLAPNLLRDFVYSYNANPASFEISGLASGGLYDLYLYSQYGGEPLSSGYVVTFTIPGAGNQTATYSTTNSPSFGQNLNYVKFSSVAASVGGNITGTFINPVANQAGVFNGFQITAVPEPGTLSMLGLSAIAGLALLRRRRRS